MYHNSPDGPRPCRANPGQCPYAAQGGEHYPTQALAQEAYDRKMTEVFGGVPTFSSRERSRQAAYRASDEVSAARRAASVKVSRAGVRAAQRFREAVSCVKAAGGRARGRAAGVRERVSCRAAGNASRISQKVRCTRAAVQEHARRASEQARSGFSVASRYAGIFRQAQAARIRYMASEGVRSFRAGGAGLRRGAAAARQVASGAYLVRGRKVSSLRIGEHLEGAGRVTAMTADGDRWMVLCRDDGGSTQVLRVSPGEVVKVRGRSLGDSLGSSLTLARAQVAGARAREGFYRAAAARTHGKHALRGRAQVAAAVHRGRPRRRDLSLVS